MKCVTSILLMAALITGLCGCTYIDPVVNLLTAYQSKDFYTSGGFQDYTDYAKYYYEGVDAQMLQRTGRFQEITEGDLATIISYIQDFECWVATVGGEVQENYDFDRSMLCAGNFYYIKSKYESEGPERRFWNYNVYYFDLDAQILYYFHNNI